MNDPASRAVRILVVDDEPALSTVLALLLEAQGYVVSVASNGREALELLRQKAPDLVITDYMMPEMDGVELTRAIKRDEVLQRVPVLLMSAAGEAQIGGHGADRFLQKGGELDRMLETVASMVAD